MGKRILPAEWAPQDAVLLTWPHRFGDWGRGLGDAGEVFIRLAQEISRRQDLIIVCYDAAHRDELGNILARAETETGRTRLCIAPSNDAWVRDHGPVTVFEDDVPLLLNFLFNGWGGKYPAELDNQVNVRLNEAACFGGTGMQDIEFVLEGGSIETDGLGTLLTTASCLLSAGRNGNQDRAAVEAVLKQRLGAERCLWLHHGMLEGDDTDGHVDMLARFVDPATIVYCSCGDPMDTHYDSLQAMHAELKTFRNYQGAPYDLVSLPLPAPKTDRSGRRLPASYANFLVINDAVLVPGYDDPADLQAVEILRACFPDREVISIPCTALIQQFGSLHCATMQLAAGVLRNPPGLESE